MQVYGEAAAAATADAQAAADARCGYALNAELFYVLCVLSTTF